MAQDNATYRSGWYGVTPGPDEGFDPIAQLDVLPVLNLAIGLPGVSSYADNSRFVLSLYFIIIMPLD